MAGDGNKNERIHPDFTFLAKIKTIVVHGFSLPNIFTALNNPVCCFYVLAFLHVKFSAREFSTWPEVGKRRLK